MIDIRIIRKMDGAGSRFKVVYLRWAACKCSYTRHLIIMEQKNKPTEKQILKRIEDDSKVQ